MKILVPLKRVPDPELNTKIMVGAIDLTGAADLADGTYVVSWNVLSGDGHPISGTFAFDAAAAAPGERPTTAPGTGPAAPAREPLIPSWGWIAAGILIIAGAVRMARRSRPE